MFFRPNLSQVETHEVVGQQNSPVSLLPAPFTWPCRRRRLFCLWLDTLMLSLRHARYVCFAPLPQHSHGKQGSANNERGAHRFFLPLTLMHTWRIVLMICASGFTPPPEISAGLTKSVRRLARTYIFPLTMGVWPCLVPTTASSAKRSAQKLRDSLIYFPLSSFQAPSTTFMRTEGKAHCSRATAALPRHTAANEGDRAAQFFADSVFQNPVPCESYAEPLLSTRLCMEQ